MKAVVIDTNACIVADEASEHADADCVYAAVSELLSIQSDGIVVMDDLDLILEEYLRYYKKANPQGAGSQFLRWLLQNLWSSVRCERVAITPLPGNPRVFTEFPDDSRLNGFDRSDRKFVAAARASKLLPEVINCVDTRSWPVFAETLASHGVVVRCLCPHTLSRLRTRPNPRSRQGRAD